MTGRKVAFALIAVILFFVVLEIGLRLAGVDRIGAERFYQNIFDPFTRPIPGMQNPYTHLAECLNNNAFRGSDFSPEKPSNTFRIICIGDSRTFSLVDYKESYPYHLQQILNRSGRSPVVEVINAGIPGTNLYQQRILFTEVFAPVEYDLVLVMAEANCRADLKNFRDREKKLQHRLLRFFQRNLYHLAIYRVAIRSIKGGVDPNVKDDLEIDHAFFDPTQILTDYWEDLELIYKQTNRKKAGLVLLTAFESETIQILLRNGLSAEDPDFFRKAMNNNILDRGADDFAARHGILFIDLVSAFLNLDPETEGLWHDPFHAGPLGNRIMAETIAKELTAHGLIPGTQ